MSLVIVTPVKDLIANNRADYFERLANSIHQQTYKDITHLIIAGPSVDDTKAYIEKYAKKYQNVKISYQETKNKWHAMNLGLKEAKGDYIQFLEDDDFLSDPDALKEMIDLIEKQEALFCFAPVWVQPDIGNRYLRKVYLDAFLAVEPFALASMVCDMNFAKDMLLFDEDMTYMASTGFILRAILSGAKGINIEKPLVSICLHNRTKTDLRKMSETCKKEMLQLDEQFFLDFAGITKKELEAIVEEGRIPGGFLDVVLMFVHPSFKTSIEKAVWEYHHRFDGLLDYVKKGYDKIYVPLIGMGDALIFSAVAHEIFKQTGKKVLVGHKNAEIFENNPYVEATDALYETPEKMTVEDIEFLKNNNLDIQYVTYWLSRPIKDHPLNFFLTYPKEHSIARSYSVCGYSGKIDIKPEMYLTEKEKSFGRFFPKDRKQIAIMNSALEMKKQYPYFQQIVDALKDEYDFVQIGAPEDTVLKNTKENTVGKLTLRQTAGVLYNSDLFVGQIGGLMHMARAVDCPAVIAYSSAEPDYLARYIANVNVGPENKCLLSQTGVCDVSCNPCLNENRYCCCHTIPVQKMIDGIREQLKRGKENLPIEVAEVKADPFKNSINEYFRRFNHVFKLDNL